MANVFDPVSFGRDIRVLLAELNIQQREAARMMGVDKCVLNRICKHGNPPSVENYLRIVGWMNKVQLNQSTSQAIAQRKQP